MKTLFFYILAVCGFFFIGACNKSKDTAVQIRVENATPWTFYNCIVDPTGGPSGNAVYNSNYGQVDINTTTAYRVCPRAYSYGYVNLTMNSKIYGIQPIDYVGETPLTPGKYTYKITYSVAGDQLRITAIKD